MSEPLYKQIADDLKHKLLSGELTVNSQLPTEKELSEQYQVSRITSKRALTELEQAGLIYRIRGKGSFVKGSSSDRTTASKKARRILFILPFLHDLSLGNFTEGLLPIMEQKQIEVVMGTATFFENKKPQDFMQEYDGLIYYAENTDQFLDCLVEFALHAFPVISLDKKNFELDFPTVLSDNLAGGQMATDWLIAAGHTRIAYLFSNLQHPQSVRNRYIGYLQALKQAGLSFHTSSVDEQATPAHLLTYIKQQMVTALVCENDLIAIEAMRQLKQAGYSIPKDLSIIGFDDIQAAQFVEPPLTTVSQNFKQIGELAGQTLLSWIEQGQVPTDINVPVNLVPRQSTQSL